MASAAGCIRAQWKGADTGSRTARLAPASLASSQARSTAAVEPEITIWPGALSLPAWQTSPSMAPGAAMASAQTFSTASISRPMRAAMAPWPTGTAFCISVPRVLSSRAVSARENVPAAARAEYSPSEWPATKPARAFRSNPPSDFSTARTARLAVMIAGWALAVRVNSSSGPSNMILESFCFRVSSTSWWTSRAAAKASWMSLPMPTVWDPCPGKISARAMKATVLPSLNWGERYCRPAPGLSRAHGRAPIPTAASSPPTALKY